MNFTVSIKKLYRTIIPFAIGIIFTFCTHKNASQHQSGAISDSLIYFDFSACQKKQIDNLFSNIEQKGFNGCVLIGQRDSIFYENSFGFANYALRDSLTAESSFQLASVSKQFTAVCILQLYQKGLLQLSDTVQKYLPDFPYKNITIHQLLVHRSGLPNYHYFLQYIPTTADTIINNTDLVHELANKKPSIYYKANQRYQYSNTGYAILATIVEKITQIPFETYLKQNIFEPLQMNNAFAYRGKNTIPKADAATGYLRYWREAEDNYLDGVLGDKGVYCSVNDLFKWDQGLYKGIIVNPDTLKKAFKPMGKPIWFKSNYGYGWRMFNWGNDSVPIKILYHAGWWHGFHSLLIRIPQDSTTIVVLKNCDKGKNASTKSLLKILYPFQTEITDSTETDLLE